MSHDGIKDMVSKAYKLIVIAIMLTGYYSQAGPALAADEPEDVINYAYSNWTTKTSKGSTNSESP